MRNNRRKRLLALGLDGGDLGFIQRNRSSLPALDKLLLIGKLFRPDPPEALSGSVWPTFYNGCHPGVHGVYQHLVWDAQRMGVRRIRPDWCYYEPFWKPLENRGLSVAVVDVPYSFTGALSAGIEISDWATHGQTWPMACNDPEVTSWIRKSRIGRETPVRKTARQLDRIRCSLIDSAAQKGRLISRLIEQRGPDVLIAVFGETHRGGHTLFQEGDEWGTSRGSALLDVYQAVDSAVAEILESAVPEDTRILVFSVHGMTVDRAQGHLVRPLMRRINDLFIETNFKNLTRKKQAGGFIRALRSHVPERIQHAIGSIASDRIRQWVVEQEMIGGLDWSRTPGFALRTDIRTELRLNLAGRESRGLLEPASTQAAAYRDLLCETFLGLKDLESGESLVDDVVSIPDRFTGRSSDRLPDYVITWRPQPSASAVHSPPLGILRARPDEVRGGDHNDEGFAILSAGKLETRSLPPLKSTQDFASFITHLACGLDS